MLDMIYYRLVMKYYIIIGLIVAVFLLLWFTRNVNAEVLDPATAPQNTITDIADNENGCATYKYGYEVGKDLQPLEKVVCK